MATTQERPDPTAVLVAVWRAQHLRLDAPPHVLVDDVGIQLADTPDALEGLGVPHDADGAWRDLPVFAGAASRSYRGLMIARARMTEDLLLETGLEQLVILGAGLDSTAIRRTDLAGRLTVFEVEQPGPQRWKQRRLAELGIAVPPGLRFVPVDVESGEDWLDATLAAGLDPARPVFLATLGLTQYIGLGATMSLFERAATLARGTTMVMSFGVPDDLVDAGELDHFRSVLAVFEQRGCPWVARYLPTEFTALAAVGGFGEVDVVTPEDLTTRYFGGRDDGLRSHSAEYFVVARLT